MAKTGYTLPVFAVASAKAALIYLLEKDTSNLKYIEIDLIPGTATIAIEQIAKIDDRTVLAITRSDPGDNLDLTRNTPIWAWVQLSPRTEQPLILEAGEGLGKNNKGEPAIYYYANKIFSANLLPLIPSDKTATVKIILPEGIQLAQRTSNEAFGILEGLALLGTSGISQPLSTEDYLEEFRQNLQEKVKENHNLVFCIGSNGQQVVRRLGIDANVVVQTGNWLGVLLVEAGLRNARSILLVGYHGKLIKLAGGIFNTSSHLADAKLEILAATVAEISNDIEPVKAVLAAKTMADAHQILVKLGLAETVFREIAQKISNKARAYVQKYANVELEIGVILFDRHGKIITQNGSNSIEY